MIYPWNIKGLTVACFLKLFYDIDHLNFESGVGYEL